MMSTRAAFLVLNFTLLTFFCRAQVAVPVAVDSAIIPREIRAYPTLNPRSFIVPSGMFLFGLFTLEKGAPKALNNEFKEELYTEHPHGTTHVDDFLQYTPAMAYYGLQLIGVHGAHSVGYGTMVLLTSNLIMAGTVQTLKHVTHESRPDGSDYYSFPSGHTATAFAGAEFLRQEYKDVSPWIGISGYAAAAATGFMRMYNDKHWFGDVVAGAGIGIASTRIAYWLYPFVQHKIFHHSHMNTMVMPGYQDGHMSIGMVQRF